MKITALLENTAKRNDMQTEHGLSLYIETGYCKILFDMGQTDLFNKNAKTLGIDLANVDVAVLSHGHYDHGGGLAEFLRINKTAPVYMSRLVFGEYFNASGKYIGLDKSLSCSDRFIFTDRITEIAPGITLFPSCEIPSERSKRSGGLTERVNGVTVPDSFFHEQYLMINEKNRRVLISGCSHMGIEAIMERFHPDMLVGGFHFSKLPADDAMASAAKHLNSYNTEYHTCHCTGTEQYEFMKHYMKNLHYLASGDTLDI